jgi:hypothetical protein
LQKSIIQLRDLARHAGLRFKQPHGEEYDMVTETKDRFINTATPVENDQAKRQPNDRDESPDAQDQKPRGVIRQAQEDLAQGLVDTDARETPGVEQATQPAPGATGQANPLPGRERDMRDHDTTVPGREKKQ